jgi:hypothetical protein
VDLFGQGGGEEPVALDSLPVVASRVRDVLLARHQVKGPYRGWLSLNRIAVAANTTPDRAKQALDLLSQEKGHRLEKWASPDRKRPTIYKLTVNNPLQGA